MSEYPPLDEQLKNLGVSLHEFVSRVVKGNRLLASRETQLERFEICKSCERFEADANRCKVCGCYVKPKVSMTYETCPIGKWKQDESSFDQWLQEGAVDEPNKDLPIYLKRLPNGTPIHEDQYDEMLKLIEEHEGPIT